MRRLSNPSAMRWLAWLDQQLPHERASLLAHYVIWFSREAHDLGADLDEHLSWRLDHLVATSTPGLYRSNLND